MYKYFTFCFDIENILSSRTFEDCQALVTVRISPQMWSFIKIENINYIMDSELSVVQVSIEQDTVPYLTGLYVNIPDIIRVVTEHFESDFDSLLEEVCEAMAGGG